MARHGLLPAALRDLGGQLAQILDEATHGLGIGPEARRARIDLGGQDRHGPMRFPAGSIAP
jgi:hypothetical protein